MNSEGDGLEIGFKMDGFVLGKGGELFDNFLNEGLEVGALESKMGAVLFVMGKGKERVGEIFEFFDFLEILAKGMLGLGEAQLFGAKSDFSASLKDGEWGFEFVASVGDEAFLIFHGSFDWGESFAGKKISGDGGEDEDDTVGID